MGSGGTGRGEMVTTRCSADASVNTFGERAVGAGLKEGGRESLLLGDRVEVGRGRESEVDGAEGSGSFKELNELVVTTLEPLETVGSSESRMKIEGRVGRSLVVERKVTERVRKGLEERNDVTVD
jgi:hypothetical protein